MQKILTIFLIKKANNPKTAPKSGTTKSNHGFQYDALPLFANGRASCKGLEEMIGLFIPQNLVDKFDHIGNVDRAVLIELLGGNHSARRIGMSLIMDILKFNQDYVIVAAQYASGRTL